MTKRDVVVPLVYTMAVAFAVWWLMPALVLSGIVITGRGQGCTVRRAFTSYWHQLQTGDVNRKLLKSQKLISRDERGFELYDTEHGRYWTPPNFAGTLAFNLAEEAVGLYGRGALGVKRGDVVLDCGASVGVFTRFALDAGARLVVAIEPAPDNVESLGRNFAKEVGQGRVIVYPKGVWDKEDFLEMSIYEDDQAANNFTLPKRAGQKTVRVPLTTIDLLVKELKLDQINYIKMDIEGAETNAIRGAQESIARFKPRMALSTYHLPGDPIDVPVLVRNAWPQVSVECGPCQLAAGLKARPEVLYFHQ